MTLRLVTVPAWVRFRMMIRQPFRWADVTVTEGDTGTTSMTFTVSLDQAASEDITVLVNTTNGTATTADGDYTALVNQLVTINAGDTSATVTVDVGTDTKVEPDETLRIALSDAKFNGATDATRVVISATDDEATGTITNDDTASITINDVSVAEGDSGTTAYTFTITSSTTSDEDITVDWATAFGTATSGDFTAQSGTATISAGSTSNNDHGQRRWRHQRSKTTKASWST